VPEILTAGRVVRTLDRKPWRGHRGNYSNSLTVQLVGDEDPLVHGAITAFGPESRLHYILAWQINLSSQELATLLDAEPPTTNQTWCQFNTPAGPINWFRSRSGFTWAELWYWTSYDRAGLRQLIKQTGTEPIVAHFEDIMTALACIGPQLTPST
jgi:hypothetical protein